MKVRKAFWALTLCTHHVLETMDGQYMAFPVTFRHVTEKDLIPVPGWKPVGNNAAELPDYVFPLYGLEKE